MKVLLQRSLGGMEVLLWYVLEKSNADHYSDFVKEESSLELTQKLRDRTHHKIS